jgi:hypothetical protein
MEFKEPASFLGFDPGLTVGAFSAVALMPVNWARERPREGGLPAGAGVFRPVDFRLTRG